MPGETVAIVGDSGSGKSTLLGLLAGLDVPTRGDVRLDGHALGALDEDARAALRGRLLGFVFQSFQLLPSLTALENVLLPLELGGFSQSTVTAREWLTRVGLAARLQHYPKTLSGGEQQRVALARALAPRPGVMLMDEPFSGLDNRLRDGIRDTTLEILKEEGTAVVLVTHEPDEATVEHVVMPVLLWLMYLTPMLYLVTVVPERLRGWVAANPFTWLVDRLRAALLEGRIAPEAGDLAALAVALAMFAAGRWMFRRLSPHFEDFV